MKLSRTRGPKPVLPAIRRASRVALSALLALSMSLPNATPAMAASYDRVYTGINNPANTQVDLFDYWITTQNANDRDGENAGFYNTGWPNYTNVWVNQGINKDHALIFHGGAGGAHPGDCAADIFTEQIGNYGTPSQVWGPVAQGLVANTLDENGYPVLNGQYTYTYNDPFWTINHNTGGASRNPGNNNGTFNRFNVRDNCSATESLNYLFNPETSSAQTGDNHVDGKAVYSGVDGLFSVDSQGFYVYDSGSQAAHYNEGTNRFELSNQTGGNVGFWPLDDKSNGDHNDYSGMHMSMEFSMPEDGYVLNPQGVYMPMKFSFSGDDDVWVFIDGVLVGDLGGIHQPSSLEIDFQTGNVNVNRNFDGIYNVSNERGSGNPEYVPTTNILACYEAAGRSGTTEWNGNTFAAGTYHTIDFFYLERGNNESNLDIRFNMINTADFTAHKALVTADGRPLGHDEFQFEMTGYDGVWMRDEYGNVVPQEGKEGWDALMPKGADNYTTPQAAGNGDVSRSFSDEGDKWVYRVGVAADGNVNFGNADYSHCNAGDIFRYKVEEVLPADATDNGDGSYTFTKDGQTYTCPRTVYYMQAEVRYDESDGSYYLSKRYYVDDQYDIQYETNFASFYNSTLTLSPQVPAITATKKLLLGETELPLSAVERTYTFELTSSDGSRIYARATAGADGTVTFTLPPITTADFVKRYVGGSVVYDQLVRTYKMREVIPDGAAYDEASGTYTLNGIQYDATPYDVTVTANCDNGTVGTPVVAYSSGDAPTFNNCILPINISATKAWDDSAAGDTAPSHPDITFRLYIAQNTAEEGQDPKWESTSERAKHADAEQTTAVDKVIAGDATGEALTVTWDNLPAIDAEGHEIHYIVVEGTGTDEGFVAGAPTGYASALTGDESAGYTITNTLQPLTLQITKLAGPAGAEHDDLSPLEGAGFTMTRVNPDDLDPETQNPLPFPAEDERHYEVTKSTDGEGLAVFGDDPALYAGTYVISETTVPAGYQRAADVTIAINADGTATVGENAVNYDPATRTLSIEITNTELPDLPSTGGPGDHLLIASGTAMIATAMALIAWSERRRMEA